VELERSVGLFGFPAPKRHDVGRLNSPALAAPTKPPAVIVMGYPYAADGAQQTDKNQSKSAAC